MISQKYDLEERLAVYSEHIIELCKKSYKNDLVKPIINQLI